MRRPERTEANERGDRHPVYQRGHEREWTWANPGEPGVWTEAFHKLSGESSEIAETTKTVAGVMTFVGAGVNLIAAAGASICAILALRGSNGARITLCVLAGVFAGWKLMCGGYSLITSINGDSAKELRDKVGDAMYLLYAAVGIDVVLMVLAIGIIALLLVGVSNRFFNPARVPRY